MVLQQQDPDEYHATNGDLYIRRLPSTRTLPLDRNVPKLTSRSVTFPPVAPRVRHPWYVVVSLYLMKGLTTRFGRPPHPEPGRVTREKLRIPPRDLVPTRDDPLSPLADGAATTAGDTAATGTGPVADPAGAFVHGIGDSGSMAASKKGHGTPSVPPPAPSSTPSPPLSPSSRPRLSSPRPLSCEALYLVPQTLYKLHPDFDLLVAGVLTLDQSGCVVFIQAVEASMTDGLARRISGTLSAAGVRPERVILVPQ